MNNPLPRHRAILSCIIFFLLGVALFAQSTDDKPIRVACIGDSVTKGFGLKNPETQAYPVQLQAMLGASYRVENFGVSGSTLSGKGHRPYVLTDEYQKALAFKPDLRLNSINR